MKKTLILSLFFFAGGFLTHALFFPEVLSNGIVDVKNIVIPNSPATSESSATEPLITKVTFDGERFSRHNITIRKTRYLQIINSHESKLMELIGTKKELTTPRGYAESEAIQVQFNDKGQYAVADKNNPQEKMIITVK